VHVLLIRLTDAQTMRVALDTDTGVEVGAGPSTARATPRSSPASMRRSVGLTWYPART